MGLDMVHDIQRAYRKLLAAMSKPGAIEKISNEAAKVDMDIHFYPATLILMLMLLDSEVSFHIVGEEQQMITSLIHQLTYSSHSPLEEADYIFVLSGAKEAEGQKAIKAAKEGNLVDPHASATLIFEVEELSKSNGLMMKGPGIEERDCIGVAVFENWVEEREMRNSQYPMGIDIILVDRASRIVGLPRTTQLSRGVV